MWRWRCVGESPGDWSLFWMQSDPLYFLGYNEIVGTFDDNFWAEEQPDPEGPLVWNEKTVQVTVLGPDMDEVANGTDVPSDGDLLTIYFNVLRGDDQIGGYIAGHAEEQLRFKKPWEAVWSAATPWQPSTERFFWDEGLAMIQDRKAYETNDANFQALTNGVAFHDVLQRNRLIIKNCFGEDEEFIFPPHHFRAIKTGANNYKIVEIEIPEENGSRHLRRPSEITAMLKSLTKPKWRVSVIVGAVLFAYWAQSELRAQRTTDATKRSVVDELVNECLDCQQGRIMIPRTSDTEVVAAFHDAYKENYRQRKHRMMEEFQAGAPEETRDLAGDHSHAF